MWNEQPPKEFEDNMFQFIEACVSIIHQTQDNKAYTQWVKLNYMNYLPEMDDSLQLTLLITEKTRLGTTVKMPVIFGCLTRAQLAG